MTPKDKAQKLIKEYALLSWKGKEFEMDYYKKCALIVVDEILSFIEDDRDGFNWKDYYKEVKQEIELL